MRSPMSACRGAHTPIALTRELRDAVRGEVVLSLIATEEFAMCLDRGDHAEWLLLREAMAQWLLLCAGSDCGVRQER